MVGGMSNLSLDFDLCEYCLAGKENQVIFSFGAMRAEGILYYVNSDVSGPMLDPSLGKYMFYVSFIGDLSTNTCIYFLNELFDKFQS